MNPPLRSAMQQPRHFLSALLALLCALAAPFHAGAATPAFATFQSFGSGGFPQSVVMADINGDGLPDLITTDGGVSVLLNTTAPGAVTASFATKQSFATGSGAISVMVADINGDGKPDIIVANQQDATGSVSVLLNTTAPGATTATFATQQKFTTGQGPFSVAIGDVNGDGLPDIVVANLTDQTVSVLLNTTAPGAAAPSFAAQQTLTDGQSVFSVAIADLNGDGLPDIIAGNGNGTISVFRNTTAPGAATASFDAQQIFTAGASNFSVAIGDLNGDGVPDLAVANEASAVVVLLNTTAPGATTFTFATPQSFATGSGPISVALRDLNGDGIPDLVTANFFDGTVSVLVNTTAPGAATPSFATQQVFAVGTSGSLPKYVAIGDLNGDGQPDLVTANESGGNLSVLLNTTVLPGTIPHYPAQQILNTTGRAQTVTVADFNGDGLKDMVAVDGVSATISVFLNTTAPGATTATYAARQIFAAGGNTIAAAVGDFNGDGKPDIVVANQTDATVSVLLNTTAPGAATASFATQVTFAAGPNPFYVAVADINGDGKPDIIVADEAGSTVSVLLNTTAPGAATPTFAAHQTFAVGTVTTSVAVGDLNGDGLPDLVVTNRGDATVSVLLNTTTPGSATASFATQQTFAVGSFPFSVAIGDLNGDGHPDLAVTNARDGTVSVLLNTTAPGAATASFATQQTLATGPEPVTVIIADLSADGRPDLIIADNARNIISVLVNTTAPGATAFSFAAPQDFDTGGIQPWGLAIADINGDGLPDLVAGNLASGTISVLLGTANTPVSAVTLSVPAASEGAIVTATGDFTDPDAGDTHTVVIDWGDGTTPSSTPLAAGVTTYSVDHTYAEEGSYTATATVSDATTNASSTGQSVSVSEVQIASLTGGGSTQNIVAGNSTTAITGLVTFTDAAGAEVVGDYTALIHWGDDTTSAGTVVNTGGNNFRVDAPTHTYSLPGTAYTVTVDVTHDTAAKLTIAGATVNTASNNANLSGLVVTTATLSPAFAGGTLGYMSNVPDGTTSVTVTATAAQANATVKVNTVPVASGTATGAMALAIGNNTINVVVTAQDGITVQTYAITVFRTSANTDLNGDGKADLVFQNTAGQLVVWYMNGSGGISTAGFLYGGFLGEWRLVGKADLNGDGNTDLVFQNNAGQIVVWYLNGSGVTTSAAFLSTAALGDWRVVGVADLNGDGNADILLQNTAGQLVAWYLNGSGTITSAGFLYGGGLGDWRVVGLADMNNDGNADIVFQNTAGQLVVWYLNGSGVTTSAGFLSTAALGDWRVVAIADLNSDGNADILLQNTAGQLVAWYVNGAGTITSAGFITTAALGEWRVR